ncbi:dermonecrotic toxin domain-containing protein [Pseudomonas sp. HLMP]|uniref:dermonecrotic toxin domain-containing protein n=1 Tax=Pseudomonas sp. HLMP TaxID=3153767 RepID=UPI0039678C2A
MSLPYVNASGVQFVRNHLQHIPRPDRHAAEAIRDWASQQGFPLDPDQTEVVTLHYRGQQAVIIDRQPLTHAVLSNWQGETSKDLVGQLLPGHWAGTLPQGPLQLVDELPKPGPLDNSAPYSVFNGLFRVTSPARYDATTHLPVDVEAMQKFIWSLDFHARYKSMLDDYWTHALKSHQVAARINFIAACNKQVLQGSLSEAGRKLAWQAADLMPRTPGLRVRPLNVYGYTATDILCITDRASPEALLYLPGNAFPLHEFSTRAALQDWFGRQCQSDEKRQILRQHFALADTPDGLDFSGLDTALAGLGAYPALHWRSPNRPGFTTDGPWSPGDFVNYRATKYSPPIKGDLFEALTERQRQRSYADADFIITSDSEVTKAKWRSYLTASINLLAPLALVVPELAPLFALGGMAQFGLGLDQAINGKSLEDKADGVQNIEFGLMNAAPLVLTGLSKAQQLFPPKRDGFVFPTRVNGQLGYPLSPMMPPHLPEPTLQFFKSAVEPLPGGDLTTARWVVRLPLTEDGPGQLQSMLDGYNTDVLYSAEYDAFISGRALNDVDPTYYQVSDSHRGLVRIDIGERPVTDQMRMNSLRAMGVDLQLPIALPSVEAQMLQPIPKHILSIWVGDKVIPSELLATLASNSRRLTSSQYQLKLLLSNASPAAFEENLQLLGTQAPNIRVLPLEEQPFYRSFSQSPNFAQYQHALNGSGANFSSASDVLRYPLLEHEGGLYLDVDDVLLPAPSAPDDPEQAALDSLTLATSPDGLLLGIPASNETLGMHCQYNTNMLGSHPNNPTLQAISQEIHARYQADRAFYDSKPQADDAAFERYALRLSDLTGPGVFNHVVDQRLPRLRIIRQIANLRTLPQSDPNYLLLNVDADLRQAMITDLPLTGVAQIGNYHSWSRP